MTTGLWRESWAALDARIAGLISVGEFLTGTAAPVGSDYSGIIGSEVIPNARGVFGELKSFHLRHGVALPPSGADALARFIQRHERTFAAGNGMTGWSGLQFVVGVLATFRTELNYLLAETQATARSMTIRAFVHLQRSIIVDENHRQRWRTAFSAGETACERLGAVHLLLHGIWGFKANAAGERTDLVLGEPLQVTSEVESSAQALVLTEWKLVRSAGEVEDQAEQALAQARRYASGSLAGFELANTRFLVLVSEHHVQLPPPVTLDAVTHLYVNIAVDPKPPSRP